MATTKRVRFCRVTADGVSTTFHLETSSDIVLRADGSSVEQALQVLEESAGIGSDHETASAKDLAELKEQVGTLAVSALGHATKQDLEALEAKIDAKLKGKANVGTPVAFTIPMSDWKTDVTPGYPYFYNWTVTGLKATDKVDIYIAPKSIDIAIEAGICASTETIPDAFRIRCKNNPTGDISGEYVVMTAS